VLQRKEIISGDLNIQVKLDTDKPWDIVHKITMIKAGYLYDKGKANIYQTRN